MLSFIICLIVVFCFTYGDGCRGGKQPLKSGGLTAIDKQLIVEEHNRLRQYVALGMISTQPPAANMLEMKWDEELAARAQMWADQCVPAHDQKVHRDVGRFPVGQNIAATWTSRAPKSYEATIPDFNKQIKAWFDEVNSFGYNPIGGSHGTGHYSQLVWGNTSHVGCGFTFYFDLEKGYTKLYVCNYGPCGNVIGSEPYEKGLPSCNNFGLSKSRKYNGLCAFEVSSSYDSVYVSKENSYQVDIYSGNNENLQSSHKFDKYDYKHETKQHTVEEWYDGGEKQDYKSVTNTARPTPKLFTFRPFLFVGREVQNTSKNPSVLPVNIIESNYEINTRPESKNIHIAVNTERSNLKISETFSSLDSAKIKSIILTNKQNNRFFESKPIYNESLEDRSRLLDIKAKGGEPFAASINKKGIFKSPLKNGNSTSVKFSTGTKLFSFTNNNSSKLHTFRSNRTQTESFSQNHRSIQLTKLGTGSILLGKKSTSVFTRKRNQYRFGTAFG